MDDLPFAAKVSPAKLFFRSLMLMKSMTDSPSFIFLNGSIKLRALVDDSLAMLVMDSWTWCEDPKFYSSAGLGVVYNSWEWMSSLPPSLLQQEDRPVYFYVKRGSKSVYCLAGVGDDSRIEYFEFCLGEVRKQRPDNDSRDLDLHDVSFHLRSECLREVLTSDAFRFDNVMVVIVEKSVSWAAASGELKYLTERNECKIEGVAGGAVYYLPMEWKGKDTLLRATEITDTVFIHAVTDPRCRDWISFKFIVDRDNHFRFGMRGLQS